MKKLGIFIVANIIFYFLICFIVWDINFNLHSLEVIDRIIISFIWILVNFLVYLFIEAIEDNKK